MVCRGASARRTVVAHLHRLLRGVVVDEHGGGVVGRRLQDLLLEGAVPALQQGHPVARTGGHHEARVGVTALPVHHWERRERGGQTWNDVSDRMVYIYPKRDTMLG